MSQLRTSAPSSSSAAASTRSTSHGTKPHKARRVCTNRKKGRPPPQPFPFLSTAARVLAIHEIAEMVIGHLDPEELPDLAAIGQVCKLWRSITQPILYRKLDLDIGDESRDEDGEISVVSAESEYGHRQAVLYSLLCRDAATCTLVRELTVNAFNVFELQCLLSGCRALTRLHLDLNGCEGQGIFWKAGLDLLGSVGATLQELRLLYWWKFKAKHWKELLEPLKCLKTFSLQDIVSFQHMQSRPLTLHDTVTTITMSADNQYDLVSGEGLHAFFGGFTKLEHLTFSIDLEDMHLPVELLPSTLSTLELTDLDPSGYLEILLRLASPGWLPNLTETPVLHVTEMMREYVREGWEEGLWPLRAEVQRLIRDAMAGLEKRKGWKEGEPKAAYWPDLLELFPVALLDGDPL